MIGPVQAPVLIFSPALASIGSQVVAVVVAWFPFLFGVRGMLEVGVIWALCLAAAVPVTAGVVPSGRPPLFCPGETRKLLLL